MELEVGREIASKAIECLKPFCERIEVAGSIRRKCQFVHDVDLICLPSNQGQFLVALQSLGSIKIGGQKLIRVDMPTGVSLDVYVATPTTWATLLLIRTGSKQHNKRLCILARQKGMKLHADGSGLFRLEGMNCEGADEVRVAGDTEASIFEALGLPYKSPEDREVKVGRGT